MDVCLGVDGMGVPWYIEYWDMIGNVLTSAYQQILDHGYMLEEWRPITLRNVVTV